MVEHVRPLVLTLKLDVTSCDRLDALRRQHFPPERNFLSAHLTLFHALPGAQESAIREQLSAACAGVEAMEVEFPSLRSLGRGVAIDVRCEPLWILRAQLAERFAAWLTPQDRQGYRPHVTIQNKVSADAARALYTRLAPDWQPFTATGEGLLLWRYLGGPWEALAEFAFTHA